MQNICFFNSTKFWGGGEKSHLEYAINFQKRNYNVCIITCCGSILEHKAKENGVCVFSFNIGNLSFLNLKMVKQLSKFFLDQRIDTVFLNSSPDLKVGGIAARKAGVKNIVYMRGLAVPVKNTLLNRYLLTKVVTHPVPNSKDTRKMFLTRLSSVINESEVRVIYRGINFDEWDSRVVMPSNFKDDGEIIIGNVGRLVEQKGQHLFIDIAKLLKDRNLNFKIVIAGTGPLEEKLKQKVKEANLESHIIFAGFYSNIRDFLAGIDIFAFTSIWEGFGNAMVEAMYEKKPVVAFDLTSNPEIIDSNETGFLVEYPKLEEFAEKIIRLATDPELRKSIGEHASRSVRNRFSFNTIIDEWENLLT